MEIKNKINILSNILLDVEEMKGNFGTRFFFIFQNEKDAIKNFNILKKEFNDIEFEINNHQVIFTLNDSLLGCKIFFDLKTFLKNFNEKLYNEENFIVFQYLQKDDYLVFNSKYKKAYSKKNNDVKDIDNLFNYIQFLNKLKSIADNSDELNKKLVFYSSKGMFKINYIEKPFSKELLESNNIKELCNKYNFFDSLEKKDFKFIFIDEMQHSLKTSKEDNNILILLKELKNIFNASYANWQLYLSNFSFIDKIDEEKNKYFSIINKIIDTSTNQIFGIIISSLGSIYSIYKMNDIENIKYIMLGIFSFFSLIVIHHQFISLYNLLTLKSNFHKKTEDYVKKLENQNDIKNIGSNILLSIITVISFIIMIIGLNIIIFYKLYVKNDIIYFIILSIIALLFVIRFILFLFNIKSQ
ncbi:hypothetical protein [Brachyspira intermedia]|uniref:hypothetical protein n=1 Tax=Brachyspira intermedia TaxID=84377 RepID=UPI003005B7B4